MSEPRYVPTLPRGPVRLPAWRLRCAYLAGGRPYLWQEVRRFLVERVGPRASSPEEVRSLREWVDLEHTPTFEHYLAHFER